METTTIKLGGVGFTVAWDSGRLQYEEVLRTPILERQSAELPDGTLDYGTGWPFFQRDWVLGEQQYYSHEHEANAGTAMRRYQEGHGVDNSKAGRLSLLPELVRSKVVSSPTLPMCVSRNGATIYAFPAGGTMHKYAAGVWTSETVTGAVSPIVDCVNAGDCLYVVDALALVAAPTAALTSALAGLGAGNVNVGLHKYKVSFYAGAQESLCGPANAGTTVNATAINGQIALSNIPTGPAGTTGRKIYRTTSNGSVYKLLTTIANNTAEVYTDNTADSALGATEPATTLRSHVLKRSSSGAWTRVIPPSPEFSAHNYDDATAVVWTNGELYVLTLDALYAHDAKEIASEWTGGTIACSHSGGVFFSDGSNRVYLYNGSGTRLVMEDLPTGFQVQCLFSAHARLWICGQLPDGRAATYWYAQGQWGAHAYWEPVAGLTRSIRAGAAQVEHVLFADSRYGGTLRHYSPEGDVSHYLATGTAATIPYKGLTVGAGKVALAIYGTAADGIYVDASTFVASGQYLTSQTDLGLPNCLKQWFTLSARFLPLTLGQSILFEWSKDGGATWVSLGTVNTVGQQEAAFRLTGASHVAQARITLYPKADKTTKPEILAVTMRGNPLVGSGRRWNLTLDVRQNVESLVRGRPLADMDDRVDELIEKALSQEPLDFQDIRGNTYRVVVRPYTGNPQLDQHGMYSAGRVQITLDQVEGA